MRQKISFILSVSMSAVLALLPIACRDDRPGQSVIDDEVICFINVILGSESRKVSLNETKAIFQLRYIAPSANAMEYDIVIASDNEEVADIYMLTQDGSFAKAVYSQTIFAIDYRFKCDGRVYSYEKDGK